MASKLPPTTVIIGFPPSRDKLSKSAIERRSTGSGKNGCRPSPPSPRMTATSITGPKSPYSLIGLSLRLLGRFSRPELVPQKKGGVRRSNALSLPHTYRASVVNTRGQEARTVGPHDTPRSHRCDGPTRPRYTTRSTVWPVKSETGLARNAVIPLLRGFDRVAAGNIDVGDKPKTATRPT